MFQRMTFCLAFLIGLTANAQTINVRGTVSNATGKPIANATVTLAVQKLSATTTSTGAYSITKTGIVQFQALAPQAAQISLNSGILEIGLSIPSPVQVEIFDVQGNLLRKELKHDVSAGVYRLNIAKHSLAANLLVIRATVGSQAVTFHYMPLCSGKYTVSQYTAPVSARLTKTAAAAVDTIKAAANGYQAKALPISSFDTTVNITLDTNGGKNPPGPSAGCGKDLGTLKSGTYSITSAGLSRQYIIDIPAGYDKNHPYRLIFGMHCYGSNMQGVANDKYYQLKRFADSTKDYCIFVAPNGISNGWGQGQADHTFFDDMLKLFKGQLCIDTTRVFSCGFSYGAMFSYALSTNHQKQLRAVACYAPANWNIWLPTNTHEPIAFMSTTGISDPNCPFIYNDAEKKGGKYCVLGHAEDNGCTIPATIPTATPGSKTHICYEFQGCKEGYPVKFYSFDGGHQAGPMDGVSGDNSTKSWIPGETWKFFIQF